MKGPKMCMWYKLTGNCDKSQCIYSHEGEQRYCNMYTN